MHGLNWDELSPEERLLAEQVATATHLWRAVLNFRELNQAGDEADDGTVLEVCESLAMRQGRESIRRTIETSLNQQAREVEKKGRRAGGARAD